jgi:dihydrofolate reductase
MRVSLIAAVAANRVIGQAGRLPWHLPDDLRHFKRMTLGKPVVMGRKTFQSIGQPLPGRPNIVVTRDEGWRAEGVRVVLSLADALVVAAGLAGDEAMVIGGAELFAAALPIADRLYLTEVHRSYEGDVFFPLIDRTSWIEASRDDRDGDPACSFVVLERPTA